MTRETALQILTKHLTNPILLKHSLAVEAVMRSLAPLFKSDADEWGLAGLLHDTDYEKSKGHPENHGLLLFQLEPNTIPSVIEHAIKAHNFEGTDVAPESPMDWGLYCSDELTGLILEMALATKEKKVEVVTVKDILQRLTDKKLVKKAHLGPVFLAEEKLGIPLEKFVGMVLSAVQSVKEEIQQ